MKSFHWNKNFETGLFEVDRQHQHLVEIINRFGGLLAENKVVFDHIETVFKELANYAQYHFQEEERLMAEIKVDKRHLNHHVEAHRIFLHEVSTMHSGISKDNVESAKHLLDFLTHWLAYHILGQDQDMARQIVAIQAGMESAQAYDNEEKKRDNATEPLLEALSGLFDQVSARNKALVELNLNLEKKVEERTRQLTETNQSLQNALDEVKTLKGILPLCSYCKKIRDDDGYWNQVDVYISEHSGAGISHGICPDCMKELYPEIYKKKHGK